MKGCAATALLLVVSLIACHKEEQAVVGVAQNAVSAEQKAQAAAQSKAQQRDRQRASLAAIPLPTKSLYVDVRDANAWVNPFLSVNAETISLRTLQNGGNTASSHRKEVQLRPEDLVDALTALPPEAWRYGRVVAVVESPFANKKDRVGVRRNEEAVMQQLNDLGVVVKEWPER
jgi:hypothetical protein